MRREKLKQIVCLLSSQYGGTPAIQRENEVAGVQDRRFKVGSKVAPLSHLWEILLRVGAHVYFPFINCFWKVEGTRTIIPERT